MKHFDPDAVQINRTELSNPCLGIVHLAITLNGVVSLYRAAKIQAYLERMLDSTVGALYEPAQCRTHLFCFVVTPIGCDAKPKVAGLLGPQTERYLTSQ
jgi:hypothetical protein